MSNKMNVFEKFTEEEIGIDLYEISTDKENIQKTLERLDGLKFSKLCLCEISLLVDYLKMITDIINTGKTTVDREQWEQFSVFTEIESFNERKVDMSNTH